MFYVALLIVQPLTLRGHVTMCCLCLEGFSRLLRPFQDITDLLRIVPKLGHHGQELSGIKTCPQVRMYL